MRDLLQRPDLFSINTATLGYKTPLPAIIDACAARGIGAIAPWRRELQGENIQQIARQQYGRFRVVPQHLLHCADAGRAQAGG